MNPLAVVGLDPGTTTAYAVFDLQGQLLKVFSARELSSSEIITHLTRICYPLILSTDKQKVPSLVEELSRKLGAKTFSPNEDLSREEKALLVKEHLLQEAHQNRHQSDSLAAALFALKKLESRLKRIRQFLDSNPLEQKEEFFKLALLHEQLSFLAIQQKLAAPARGTMPAVKGSVPFKEKIAKKDFLLSQKTKLLEEENRQFAAKISSLKRQLASSQESNRYLGRRASRFDQRVDSLFHFKEENLRRKSEELSRQKKVLEEKEEKIKFLYSFISLLPGYQLVKKLDTLGRKEFEEKNKVLNLQPKDFLFVARPFIFSEALLKELEQKEVILLCPRPLPKVLGQRFPCLLVEEKEFFREGGYFALLGKEKLARLPAKEKLESLVHEYQKERKAEIQ